MAEDRLGPEFVILVVMLVVLPFLILMVLWAPVPDLEGTNTTVSDVFDYRQSILAIIVTTFGAWIGAGAAYYYGRENLRKATDSLLSMREPSPREILLRTPVRDLSLKPVDLTVELDDQVGPVHDRLKERTRIWFVPIVDEEGALVTVIEDEAVFHFMDSMLTEAVDLTLPDAITAARSKTMREVIGYLEDRELDKEMMDVFVTVTMDTKAAVALELMEKRRCYLSIVTDDAGRPLFHFDTGDVRRVLLGST